jgi:dihydrofolate reductase
MARLVYSAITSLDGYVADADGKFDWAEPGEEVFRFVNELERPIGTYLYGRRMYETMAVWGTPDVAANLPLYVQDFARIWKAADKVVYSKTLERATTERTRVERDFQPAAVRRLKQTAPLDMSMGGAHLAAQAIAVGLVDECHLFLTPVIVGGGTPALPSHVRTAVELMGEHAFRNGVVHLHYGLQAV